MTNTKIGIPKDLTITLDRTMCPGSCPDYSLLLHGDGKIVYEGRRYVASKGRREGRIPASRVREIFEEFHRIGYFSLRDRYDAVAKDGAITKTSIRANGMTKQVVNCHPSQAPDSLYNLEKLIDEISHSERWVKNRSGQAVLEP